MKLPSQPIGFVHFMCREYLLPTRFSRSDLGRLEKRIGVVRCPDCAVPSEARLFIPISAAVTARDLGCVPTQAA